MSSPRHIATSPDEPGYLIGYSSICNRDIMHAKGQKRVPLSATLTKRLSSPVVYP